MTQENTAKWEKMIHMTDVAKQESKVRSYVKAILYGT